MVVRFYILIILTITTFVSKVISIVEDTNTNSFMNKLRNSSIIISEDEVFKKFQGKTVNIKIGVLDPNALNAIHGAEHFWIEFDPIVPLHITDNRLLLPFIVSPDDDHNSNFYKCVYPGCSSIYEPSGLFSNVEEMRISMLKLCKKIEDDKIPVRLWDNPSNIDQTIAMGLLPSFACYSRANYSEPVSFPAITLKVVVDWIPFIINYLDIDAQGADLALLYSISDNLHKIRHVKIECQREPDHFLYKNKVNNECNDIINLLQKHSFTLHNLEVNNCGIGEFNVYMTNKDAHI